MNGGYRHMSPTLYMIDGPKALMTSAPQLISSPSVLSSGLVRLQVNVNSIKLQPDAAYETYAITTGASSAQIRTLAIAAKFVGRHAIYAAPSNEATLEMQGPALCVKLAAHGLSRSRYSARHWLYEQCGLNTSGRVFDANGIVVYCHASRRDLWTGSSSEWNLDSMTAGPTGHPPSQLGVSRVYNAGWVSPGTIRPFAELRGIENLHLHPPGRDGTQTTEVYWIVSGRAGLFFLLKRDRWRPQLLILEKGDLAVVSSATIHQLIAADERAAAYEHVALQIVSRFHEPIRRAKRKVYFRFDPWSFEDLLEEAMMHMAGRRSGAIDLNPPLVPPPR